MDVDIDENLRVQSKLLLRKLKEKQGKLQRIINPSTNSSHSISRDLTTSELSWDPNLEIKQDDAKSVRSKLIEMSKIMKDDKNKSNLSKKQNTINKENKIGNTEKVSLESDTQRKSLLMNVETDPKSLVQREKKDKDSTESDTQRKSVIIDMGNSKKNSWNKDLDGDKETLNKFEKNSHISLKDNLHLKNKDKEIKETPVAVRRRRIIDKNVKVDGDLNASQQVDCTEDYPHLNFSYSDVTDKDLNFLQSRLDTSPKRVFEFSEVKDDGDKTKVNFEETLENPANNRKIAKFIREANKPKSILLTNGSRQNKSASKVSFRTSGSPSRSFQSQSQGLNMTEQQDQRLLGYDWIAALIENDPAAMDLSENFFDELKEFRRRNKDECINNYYMEGPQYLWENRDKEDPVVAKALEDTKVKPYTVNDRLFTKPLKNSLFADYQGQEEDISSRKETEPTYEEPRFVRVSIPRSTLESPHRVRPHRRNSFNQCDSYALSAHCLKGWENSRPSMMPSASSVSLRDSSHGLRPSMKTTLDEAERLAANFPYPWDPTEQRIRQPTPNLTDPSLLDSYRANPLPHSMRSGSSFTERGNTSHSLKQATDDLLNSTYSLMYEMERVKRDFAHSKLHIPGRIY
ncbi:hypothetical protein CHS0354_006172 [Potamilus streckersoni]|uniref:Uncharacterized protein n=1 Tax=Potamilus streckersoni TaxID=2493646 RepID=A0AAE0ST87_9BIVA|nr:hypothetical protein CHS0354_006172 [Potamilus streckersoni]